MLSRALLALGFAATVLVFGCQSVIAEEQMAWTVDRYPSDAAGMADTVILSYGIPETDAVAFEAICGGPDGVTPRAVFWYDTVDLDEGEDVVLSLSVEDLTEKVVAQVYGKDAEVGVSGFQATLNATSPIWQAMKNDGVLTYGLSGGEQQKLHLTGAARAIQAFTTACKTGAESASDEAATTGDGLVRDTMAQATASSVAAAIRDAASGPPNGVPSAQKARPVSCDAFGTIKSAHSETPVEITFVNKADGYRGLMWIDTEGTPIDNTGLNQGETAVIPTFQTHAWMITDGPGNCIEMVVAGEGDTTFEITAPAPVLGPEND